MIELIVLAAGTVRTIQSLTTHKKEYEELKKKKLEEWNKLSQHEQQSRAVYSVMNR